LEVELFPELDELLLFLFLSIEEDHKLGTREELQLIRSAVLELLVLQYQGLCVNKRKVKGKNCREQQPLQFALHHSNISRPQSDNAGKIK